MKKKSLFFIFLLSNLISFAQEVKLERFPVEAVKPLQDNEEKKLYAIFLFNNNICSNICTIANIQSVMLDIEKTLGDNTGKTAIFMLDDSIDVNVFSSNFPQMITETYYTYEPIFPKYCDRNKLDYVALLFVKNDGEVVDKYTYTEYMEDKIDYDRLKLILSDIIKTDSISSESIKNTLNISAAKSAIITASITIHENADTTISRPFNWQKKGDTLYGIDELTKNLYSLDVTTGNLFKYNELPIELATYFQDKSNNDSSYINGWKKYLKEYNTRRNNRNSMKIRDNIFTNVMAVNDTAVICGAVLATTYEYIAACGTDLPDVPNVMAAINKKTQKTSIYPLPDDMRFTGIATTWGNNDLLMFHDYNGFAFGIDYAKEGKYDTIPIASVLRICSDKCDIIKTVRLQDLKLDTGPYLRYYLQNVIHCIKNNSLVFYIGEKYYRNKNNLLIYDINKKKSTQYNIPYLKELDGYELQCVDYADDLSAFNILYRHKLYSQAAIVNYDLKDKITNIYSLQLPAKLSHANFINSSSAKATLLIKYGEGIRWRIEEIKL